MFLDDTETAFYMGGFHTQKIGANFNNWMSVSKMIASSGSTSWNMGIQITQTALVSDFSVRSLT